MDIADLLTELNIRIGDTSDFTFTSDEKTSALESAINDKYVVTDNWDTSLTFSTGTYQYTKPAGVDIIEDIYIKADNSQDYPEPIDSGLWEVFGDNIQFTPGADVVPQGYSLYLKSNEKSSTADTFTEPKVQEYLLALAQLRLYRTMLAKKTMRFLKNDTTVGEIVATKRDLESEVAYYRQSLTKGYQSA